MLRQPGGARALRLHLRRRQPRARDLAAAWPEHDFSGIEEIWWPQVEEPADQVLARAALFRAEMAALPDWSDTLVVCHWGFIMSLTGR